MRKTKKDFLGLFSKKSGVIDNLYTIKSGCPGWMHFTKQPIAPGLKLRAVAMLKPEPF